MITWLRPRPSWNKGARVSKAYPKCSDASGIVLFVGVVASCCPPVREGLGVVGEVRRRLGYDEVKRSSDSGRGGERNGGEGRRRDKEGKNGGSDS